MVSCLVHQAIIWTNAYIHASAISEKYITIAKIKYEIYLFNDFFISTSQYSNVSLIKVELNAIM